LTNASGNKCTYIGVHNCVKLCTCESISGTTGTSAGSEEE